MTSWWRYLLVGIELAHFSHCQTDIDEDEEDEDENEPDEDEDDDDISSALPPAPSSVPPPASVPVTSSLAQVPTSITTTSIPPTPVSTTPTGISTFATSETSTAQAETEPASNGTLQSSGSASASPGGLSAGTKAGIGVGTTLAVLLIMGTWLFVWKRRHTRRTKTKSKGQVREVAQNDSQSPRHSLHRFRRSTMDDYYAPDSEAKPRDVNTQQDVHAHCSEKDAGFIPLGVARRETERHELSAEVPTYELEGEVQGNNSSPHPRSPPGQTVLSPVSPLSTGTNQRSGT